MLAAFVVTGCQDDDSTSATVGTLAGRVDVLPDGLPSVGTRVVLLDPSTNDSPFPTAVTDAEGRYRFEQVPPGWYHPLFEAGPMIVYAPLDHAIRIDAGHQATFDVSIAAYPGLDGAGRRVRGVVLDAESGAPIAGAWISAGFTDPGFLVGNGTPPWETRTDASGRFELSGVPLIQWSESRTGLFPLVATHRDYRPGATGSLARGEILPILPASGPPLEVEIRLTAGSGERTLTGRVEGGGGAVAGVPVALTFADIDVEPPAPAGAIRAATLEPRALVPGAVRVTDTAGAFSFEGLAPGRYRVHAGYFPDDGWVPASLEEGAPPPVILGTVDVHDLVVRAVPAIPMVAPTRLELLHTVRPELVWAAVPGVDLYTVRYSWANSFFLNQFLETPDTSCVLPPELFRAGDQGRWAVQAWAEGHLVASSEYVGTFTIGQR